MTNPKSLFYNNYVSSGQAGKVDGFKPPQEVLKPRMPFLRSIIKKLELQDRSERVIDLGCGHGAMLYMLKQSGFTNVAGVDISKEQVDIAHRWGIYEVQCGDVESFLEQEGEVGVFFMLDVLEHLTPLQAVSVLSAVASKLKKGGLLVIHVPNGEGIFGQRIRYGDLTHETCFTPKSIRQLLKSVGLGTIKCFEDKPLVYSSVGLFRRIVWDLGTLYWRILLAAESGERSCILSQNMLVIAKK